MSGERPFWPFRERGHEQCTMISQYTDGLTTASVRSMTWQSRTDRKKPPASRRWRLELHCGRHLISSGHDQAKMHWQAGRPAMPSLLVVRAGQVAFGALHIYLSTLEIEEIPQLSQP